MPKPWEKYTVKLAKPKPWEKYGDRGIVKPYEPPLSFTNEGIAEMLGGPVDLVAFGLRKLGLNVDRPALGSENIKQMMGLAGVRTPAPGVTPQTTGQYAAKGLGEAAGALLPFTGLTGRVAQTARPLAAPVAQTMMQSAANRPALTIAGELAAGGGAGVGRQVGETQFPGEPGKQSLAELAGGLTAAAAPSAAIKVPWAIANRLPVAGHLIRGAKGAIVPFTEAGGRVRASNRLRDLVPDPEAAARAMDEENISGLSPSEMTGDERLMAMERKILDADATADKAAKMRRAESSKALRGEMEGMAEGDISATRGAIEARRSGVLDKLYQRAEAAAETAKTKLEGVTPSKQRIETSAQVRDEIDAALKAARKMERELWRNVPQDANVPTTAGRDAYLAKTSELSRAQMDNIPAKARRFLDPGSNEKLAAVDTVKEVHGLYSALRTESRLARSAGEFDKARVSDDIADAILDDLGAGVDTTEVGEMFNAARGFSFELNQKFRQGAVGRILGYTKEGGLSTPAELTLDVTTGRGGPRGLVDTNDILRAVEGGPEQTRDAIGQFLRQKFTAAAVDQGQVNPAKARNFVQSNKEVLDQFPELQKSFLDAGQAQQIADTVGKASAARAKRLQSPSISKTAEFLNARVGEEISRVYESQNPRAMARELRKQVSKDKTRKAVDGLKSGFVDYLINRATTKQFDEALEPVISGRGLLAALLDPKTQAMAGEWMAPQQMARLERIAKEFMKLETAQGRLPSIGGVMQDTPATIITLVGTTLGARTGAQLGKGTSGASLKTASFMSKQVNKFLGNITNDKAAQLIHDAMDDKELYQSLLRGIDTVEGQKFVNRRLNAWLAGPGSRVLDDDNSEE